MAKQEDNTGWLIILGIVLLPLILMFALGAAVLYGLFKINKLALKFNCKIRCARINEKSINWISGLLILIPSFVCLITYHCFGIVDDNQQIIIFLSIYLITILFVIIPACISNFYIVSKTNSYYKLGDKHYSDKQYKKALEYYKEAQKYECKENPYYYYATGLCFNKLQNHNEAVRYLQKAILLDKGNPELYCALAEIHLSMEKFKLATQDIENCLKLSKNGNLSDKTDSLKKKIRNHTDILYRQSLDLIKVGKYVNAIKTLERALEILPDDPEYISKLEEIKNTIETEKKREEERKIKENKQKAKSYYNEALQAFKNGSYEKAMIVIDKALKKLPDSELYINLKKDIEDKANKDMAEKLYIEAQFQYENQKYEIAKAKIQQAIRLIPNEKITSLNQIKGTNYKYKTLLNNIESKIATQEAEYRRKRELEEAEAKRKKKLQDAQDLYMKGLRKLKDGNFEGAVQDLKQAISLNPNYDYKQALEKAQEGKIDIETCTKKAILTLNGFDEEKAEQFMNDRKVMKWYDLDSFANYFNLQPHERVQLEDKIIFPLKPQVKRGRSVDF